MNIYKLFQRCHDVGWEESCLQIIAYGDLKEHLTSILESAIKADNSTIVHAILTRYPDTVITNSMIEKCVSDACLSVVVRHFLIRSARPSYDALSTKKYITNLTAHEPAWKDVSSWTPDDIVYSGYAGKVKSERFVHGEEATPDKQTEMIDFFIKNQKNAKENLNQMKPELPTPAASSAPASGSKSRLPKASRPAKRR